MSGAAVSQVRSYRVRSPGKGDRNQLFVGWRPEKSSGDSFLAIVGNGRQVLHWIFWIFPVTSY